MTDSKSQGPSHTSPDGVIKPCWAQSNSVLVSARCNCPAARSLCCRWLRDNWAEFCPADSSWHSTCWANRLLGWAWAWLCACAWALPLCHWEPQRRILYCAVSHHIVHSLSAHKCACAHSARGTRCSATSAETCAAPDAHLRGCVARQRERLSFSRGGKTWKDPASLAYPLP